MVACSEDRLRIRWQQSVFPDWDGFFQLTPDIERMAADILRAIRRGQSARVPIS